MGTTATLERMFWFDDQARRRRYPNASRLAERFELSARTAQRCIEFPTHAGMNRYART